MYTRCPNMEHRERRVGSEITRNKTQPVTKIQREIFAETISIICLLCSLTMTLLNPD